MEIVSLPNNLNLRTLSHELRVPLTPILAFAHELLDTDLTVKQKNQVQEILSAGNRLLQLAEKLVAVKRLANLTGANSETDLAMLADFITEHFQRSKK